MSMEQTAYVPRGNVPNRERLQAAVDSLGYDCKIDTLYVPFECSGFLPCVLSGKLSGFEIYFDSPADLLQASPSLTKMVGTRDVAITFRWGGDMAECACVLIVCAALAKSFDAVVHYHDDDMLYSADQLLQELKIALQST
jgi:hypothetical protein